jgi:protein ImuA
MAIQQTFAQEVLLRQLRVKAGCIATAPDGDAGQTLSTGSAAINRLLPRGGLRVDAITEWVAEADGSGAAALSMITAATHLNSARGRGPLVVVSRRDNFYPPAAVSLGISADRIIWVQPARHADLVWAIDQALRCESVAAVWAPIRAKLDDRDARRFQLAAEAGHTPGLLIRAAATRGCPSFADVRFHVGNLNRGARWLDPHACGRVMNVTLDRCRGGRVGHSVWVQIDDQARIDQVTPQQLGIGKDETAAVRLASELAHPTAANRRDRKPSRRSA